MKEQERSHFNRFEHQSIKGNTSQKNKCAAPFKLALLVWLISAGSAFAQEETLPSITVNALPEAQDGYRATKTRVGKVEQDPHDVPQAVTTITRALMEEQEANSLREALRNVSGLSFNSAEGGRSGDNMNLRGFYTFGDIYLDGIRDTAQYNRELFNLEQVDVLRGAAAMLFGRGQAGGVINQVSKVPMLKGENKILIGGGTDGFAEIKTDLNHRLGETTAVRLNMMSRAEDSSRSNPLTGTTPEIRRQGFAPSISFGLGTNHELTLSHLWVKTNDRPDYGVPFNRGSKKPEHKYGEAETYWGVEGNFDKSETNISTANYLHTINGVTQWRTVIRSANYKRAYWAASPGQTPSALGGGPTREFETDDLVIQSDLNTKFSLWNMKNELVTGVEYLKEDSKRWTLANLGTAARPIYQAGHFPNRPPNTYSGNTYSAYLQNSLEFIPNWKITLGIRRDEMRSEYQTSTATATATNLTQFSGNFGENSYRSGLSWQPTEEQHYYISWSDSFSPTADLYQLSGSSFPAERSEVTEIGAKWLLLNGKLSFRTALYHATKEWERNSDLESTAAILTKRRVSDGIEFEIAAKLNEKWEVFSGLSLINAKILEVAPVNGNPNFIGRMPRNTPRQTFNLWTSYQLPYGFKIGGGVEFKSKRYGASPTGTAAFNPNTVPSYARWDAMLAYEKPKYTVKLNVQNVFDKLYYDALYDNGGFSTPGQSRRVTLTAEYKF